MAEVATLTAGGRPALPETLVDELARRLGETPGGAERRRRAAALYRALPGPDRVRHLWKYTDPARLLPAAAAVELAGPGADAAVAGTPGAAGAASAAPEAPRWGEGGLPAATEAGVVLRPGLPPALTPAASAAGFALAPLAASDLAARLGEAVPADHGLFEALNAAAWDAGLAVRVPAGSVLTTALRVVVPAGAGLRLPRLLVVAERGAAATVVEEHHGGGAGGRVAGVTELFVAPGAELRHVVVQRWAAGVTGHLTARARLERDARLLTVLASLGGDAAKLDLGAVLAGEGARSELVGVALGTGRQHFDHHTTHEHRAGRTWSNLDFKVALAGRARSAYTGLIRIEEGAPHSEAYQENRNLMLSDACRADTIPELEILTDEVACTHGATVAPVDGEHLFYLRSRGLPAAEALRLIVRGFLETTLSRLPEALREQVEALVAPRLASLAGGAP